MQGGHQGEASEELLAGVRVGLRGRQVGDRELGELEQGLLEVIEYVPARLVAAQQLPVEGAERRTRPSRVCGWVWGRGGAQGR